MSTRNALPAERRLALLEQAESLVEDLSEGKVRRTEVSLLANVLFYVPGGWSERLEEARTLLKALPESGLVERSESTLTKYQCLQEHLEPVLQMNESAAELRFLLGWLMRLLVVHERTCDEEEGVEER